jgi:hypothetical protein
MEKNAEQQKYNQINIVVDRSEKAIDMWWILVGISKQ